MFKSTLRTFITSFCLALSFATSAQDAQTPSNLSESFEELKAKSADYEQYQVVPNTRLNSFWKQITDTITAKENAYQNATSEINSLNKKMQDMEAEMAQKDQKVEESQYLVDHLTVLGISMSKSGYVYLNFFIILALAAVIGIGFGRFKENERVTSENKKLASDAEVELENFKKKAKEKEMKLRRELQTEINKNEDLGKEIIQLKKKKAAQ